ncbi:MAG: asparagine synthase (glutamine-hydrolyzing) [Ruminococcus flavefaciens]|nr:asparagine synthase (glutamine-hydrolyzing) [Ruminococcus flavefaciens]
MCGIAGFFDAHTDFTRAEEFYRQILGEMRMSLVHRGPDGEGIQLFPHCGIAHTRLAIIDLEGGAQPMSRTVDGREFHIVYNGELYNTKELRRDLEAAGWQFYSDSDTEVILVSYLEYGEAFVNRLDGIFAIGIYNLSENQLYLYRDSFGIKPLFYYRKKDTLLFASEPKGIFCFPAVCAKLDKDGINEVMGLGPARNPGSGTFLGMREVRPGCYLKVDAAGIREVEYWHLESRPHEDDYQATIEKTAFLLEDAICRQMVSDVPICTFLSGGIDSSVVTAICARHMQKRGESLDTYSFDFTGNDRYFRANSFQPSQDRPYVDKMVEYLNTRHHYLECDYETQAALLYASVDSHDLPCMADIDSSLIHFCGEVSKLHKVVLTGECADEVFGGYPWFHREEFLTCGTFPWTPDLTPRKNMLRDEVVDSLAMDEFIRESYENAIQEIAVLPEENETERSRRRIGYLNIRYFMQTLLNRMDRTSMHSGLEARVPFADRKLVEYIFNVPWEMKAKDGVVKNVLRQASRGMVPDEVLFRRKSPYPKTYNPYYEKLLSSRMERVLEKKDAPIWQLADPKRMRMFLKSVKDYGAPWYGQLMAGPQMIAYLLQLNYWMEKYQVTLCW